MATIRGLATPSIIVNNNTVAIVPNSFKYKAGAGERTITTQSSGGSNVDIVVTENAETLKSYCSFDMKATTENIQLYELMQSGIGTNSVLAADNQAGFSKAFDQMTVTSDAEISLSQDGAFTVELEGAAIF